jgi:hypothetical protein
VDRLHRSGSLSLLAVAIGAILGRVNIRGFSIGTTASTRIVAVLIGQLGTFKMVKEMASGQTLRLEFVDSSLLTLATSLPLDQFASAHKGAPAQTFEQDIDE